MSDLTISIQGVDRLIAKFGKVQGVQVLRPPMGRSVDTIWRYMTKYPDRPVKRPGYKRGSGPIDKHGKVIKYSSEQLGDKWTRDITNDGDGLTGKVGNNVSYAGLVQSKKFQASVHKKYWTNTDANAITQNRSAIVKDFNASIREALR